MSELNQGGDRLQVHNVGSYAFEQTGRSSVADAMGMREMQARAFEKRNAQYLLIQAPPACGKSRALMFLALDKVINQGINKVIISVPQLSIGSSFNDTELSKYGFFADWHIDPKYNLCYEEDQKVERVLEFLTDPCAHYLLCSHASLVYFYEKLKDRTLFDNALIAVDEFHHVSQDEDNKLGNVIHSLMKTTSAHIVAMTGSYFRGDTIPILSKEDERKFERVIYTYYEQLNGYKYLESLGIDYAFYEGSWLDAIELLLDLDKKTIIHIPHIQSRESTHDKHNDLDTLIGYIGTYISTDEDTGIITVKAKNGKILRIADLVSKRKQDMQHVTLAALREADVLDKVDFIIALEMAKEGFDWPQCEYALTVGYRSSLTEVVQIIGRATRDYPGKSHAQFTNLLAMPYGAFNDIKTAVNDYLKAISLSLLMEQVLAPNVHFRARSPDSDITNNPESSDQPQKTEQTPKDSIVISIKDGELSSKSIEFLNNNYQSIIETVFNSSNTVKLAFANGGDDATKELVAEDVADAIRSVYPQVSEDELHDMALAIVKAMVVKSCAHSNGSASSDDQTKSSELPRVEIRQVQGENTAFLRIKDKMVNVDDIDFNMIGSINPFANAFMFVSKSLNPFILKQLQTVLSEKRQQMTEPIARSLWPYVNNFRLEHNREPSVFSTNDYENRLATALSYARKLKRQQNAIDAAKRGG